MLIIFNKYKKIEYFNGKEYPIGTAFTKIYNQLSGLTYNSKFALKTYKDANLWNHRYKVLEKINYNLLVELFELKNHYEANSIKQEIKIENIEITDKAFEELVKLCIKLDEFIRLAKKDKRTMKEEKVLFYFTGINDYEIPSFKVEDDDIVKKINNELLINSNKNDGADEIYNNIIENDKKIMSAILNSKNIIYKYNCEDFIQVLLISYIFILKHNIYLKQCELCGRFFIANKGQEKFCNNIRPRYENEKKNDYLKTKMTCKEYNRKKLYNLNLDEVKKAKRTISLRIEKRIRNKIEDKEYLTEWKNSLEKKREKLIDNKKYADWILNESDTHQIRRKNNGSKRTDKK